MNEPILTQSGTYACPKCGGTVAHHLGRIGEYWFCEIEGCSWRSDVEDDE